MDLYILDDDGNVREATDGLALAKWRENANARVALDHVGDVRISTVFLAIDHAYRVGSKPILWETMVFGGDDDEWQQQYSSKADAQAGHDDVVKRLRAGERLGDEG